MQASTFIAAPVDRVWDVLQDQRRMRRWSPETWAQLFLPRRLAPNQLSLNLNQRKAFVWPTLSRYVEVAAPERLAFRVYGPGALWSYRLEPQDGGTRLVVRRDLIGGRRTLLSRVVATLALGGIDEHDDELVAGMDRTLAAIASDVAARGA
ncbi:SRPBCC family protein [Aeromicrobium duanguangcaii]|uniref:SRPBCC family protein n=1 Tax=Aeromicrobium duanguangcaii TaxID=2968086 RepID=UPI0024B508FE|nr:SRPBCC family protein [Aeromicrobium duanguangcaii]